MPLPTPLAMLRRTGRWLAFLLFLAFSVGLGLEAAVRVVIPQMLIRELPDLWEPSTELGWRRRPHTRVWVNTAGREVEICTDERGDRIDCDVFAERTCVRRVLVIGDSFVEALAVPFRDTVWSRLERETGACTEVAGVGGYGLSQYAALARERLEDPARRYDLVLLNFYSGNDFTRDAAQIPSHRFVELARATLGPPPPRDGSAAPIQRLGYAVNRWLAAHSHAYCAAIRAIPRLRAAPRRLAGDGSNALRRSTLRNRLLEETARGMQQISEEVERAGSRLLVVVIPHPAQVTDPRGIQLVARIPVFEGDVDMDLVRKRFVPRIERIPDVAVVDLLPYLREHATMESWAADRHLSSQGHELWFEALRGPVQALLSNPL